MRKILEASVVFRWLTAAAQWFDSQWRRSRLSVIFTGETVREKGPASLAGRLAAWLHSLWCGLFEKLRLTRALQGSVFKRMFFWCATATALAPLVPTMAALALAAVGVLSVMAAFGCDRELRLHYSPVNKWTILFAAVYLTGTFTSVDLAGSLESGLLTVFFVLFTVALQASVTERRQVDRIIYLITAAGAVMSLFGILQALTGMESDKAWIDEDSFSDITLRVYAFLDNPNVLAEYLLLVIPFGVSCAVTAPSRRGRILGGLATAAMVVCMLLTYSRGGWLGLLLAAALFLVLLDRRTVVLGIAGIVALIFVLPDSILDRFTSITDMTDSSSSYRISIWLASLNMLRDYWLFGVGTGQAAFSRIYPLYSFNAASAAHSHSLYLQVVCECGVLGLVTLGGAVFSCIRAAGSALNAALDRRTRFQLIAVLSALTGFLVQSAVEYSFYNYRVMLMFWVVIALGAMLSHSWPEEATP